MSAVVAGAGPAHACFFATYEHAKHSLQTLTRHRHDHLTHGLYPNKFLYVCVFVLHQLFLLSHALHKPLAYSIDTCRTIFWTRCVEVVKAISLIHMSV